MDLATLQHSIRVCLVPLSLSPSNNNTEMNVKGIWWGVSNALISIKIRTSGEILRAWYEPRVNNSELLRTDSTRDFSRQILGKH
jgi:hypothetical protein